jgi:hypothetical protein
MALRQRTRGESFAPPESFSRDEFIEERFHYKAGEHVTFLAPTQAGKTTLAFELLEETASVDVPAIVLVQKPKDSTLKVWTDHLKTKSWVKSSTWPPNPIRKKAPGYIVWPNHSYKPDADNAKLRDIFKRAILDSYRKGNRIIFADETYYLSDRLNLEDELIQVWAQGAGLGCGLWAATQRPAYIPLWAYSQAEHLFLANDPDKRARIRYGEIGGINARFVESQVERLPKYHWLYVRRTGPATCIVRDK